MKIFHKNIISLIERLERRIIAGSELLTPGVSTAELDEFTQNASNLADIEIYIKKWNLENIDLNKRLDDKIEDIDNNIEVVISSDKKDKNEKNNNIDNFIINNNLEKNNKNNKNNKDNIEKEEKEKGDDNNNNNKE